MSMNGTKENPLNENSSGTPDTRTCGIISAIPNLGMSSCRGRAEAFARTLSSKLRTLGSQSEDGALSPEDESTINDNEPNHAPNTWRTATDDDAQHAVTDLQPLRHESDSFFDFDCELESPGSPADECEYLRLIETSASTTPPHNSAAESGYICASTSTSSRVSGDIPYEHDDEDAVDGAERQAPSPLHNGYDDDEINAQDELEQQHHENHHDDETDYKSLRETAVETVQAKVEEVDDDLLKPLVTEETVAQLTPVNLAHVQDEIISELREHSARVGTLIEATQTQENSDINEVPETQTQEQSVNVKSANKTILTNEENIDNIKQQQQPHNATTENTKQQQATAEERAFDTSHKITAEERAIDTSHKTAEERTIETSHKTADERIIETSPSPKTAAVTQAINEVQIVLDTRNKSDTAAVTSEHERISTQEPATTTTPINSTKTAGEKEEVLVDSHVDEHEHDDDEDEDCRPQRIRRCSSLKSGKTPPGTPGRKKIVRFADALGLDLADIKTFLDEIPTIPKSAFEDLEVADTEPPIQLGPKSDKLLVPLFQQPGGLPNFLDLVREKQVSLENAAVTDHMNQTITGTVRVRNLDFHKSVHIRYSLDNWRSYADLQANYVENSCDGFSDKFTFFLFGNSLRMGQRIEFAVRFQCKGQQFWDSNYGTNYCFQCLPASTQTSNISGMSGSAVVQAIRSGVGVGVGVGVGMSGVPRAHSGSTITSGGLYSPSAGDDWCSSFY